MTEKHFGFHVLGSQTRAKDRVERDHVETCESPPLMPCPVYLPGEREIVSVILQSFGVLLEVEVGVAQLAVNGTEGLQIFRSYLNRRLEERCPTFKVSGFAQTLTF